MPDKTEIRIGDFILSYCQIFVNISPKFYIPKDRGRKEKTRGREHASELRAYGTFSEKRGNAVCGQERVAGSSVTENGISGRSTPGFLSFPDELSLFSQAPNAAQTPMSKRQSVSAAIFFNFFIDLPLKI